MSNTGDGIDPRAVIDPSAKIGKDVSIGPFSVIGPDVEIGEGTWVGPHVVINGPCRIGRENKIFQFSSIGEMPQDKKYGGEPTTLEIGDRNVIREFCTLNRGTVQDIGATRVGNDNWIMAYVHVAHDCIIGNNTIFANNTNLAGHVIVEDYAIIGGAALIHQFCTIGAHSFIGMGSAVSKSVPPFFMAAGQPAKPHGLNSEGLRRRDFAEDSILALKRAYKTLYRQGLTVEQAVEAMAAAAADDNNVRRLVEFVKNTERGIVR